MIFEFPQYITDIVNKFDSNGYKAYVAGGALRDLLLNMKPRDFDLVTDARIEEVKKIFNNTVNSGKNHNTVGIVVNSRVVDVTTLRGEIKRTFYDSLIDDLKRRDFTINSLAYDLLEDNLIDPFNSIDNLKNRVVLIKSNEPEKRFSEDPIRTLRSISLISRLEEAGKRWRIDLRTLYAIFDISHEISSVPFERINRELMKILPYPRLYVYLSLLRCFHILDYILPEMKKNFSEKTRLLQLLSECDIEMKLAALFFDENLEVVRDSLLKLKFSKQISKEVLNILRYSRRDFYEDDYSVRRSISDMGEKLFFKVLRFAKAVETLKSKDVYRFSIIENKAKKFLYQKYPLFLRDLKVNGFDLIKEFGFKGDKIGVILKDLLNLVLKEPGMNEKELLFDYIRSKKKAGFPRL